jgi:hypothetical protein
MFFDDGKTRLNDAFGSPGWLIALISCGAKANPILKIDLAYHGTHVTQNLEDIDFRIIAPALTELVEVRVSL